MSASWAKAFYTSKAWKQNRKAYLESVDGLCERCRVLGKFVPAEIVHHRKWLTKETIHDPNLTMGWDNLEALCQDCHNKEHFGQEIKPRFRFTEDGSILM